MSEAKEAVKTPGTNEDSNGIKEGNLKPIKCTLCLYLDLINIIAFTLLRVNFKVS